MNEDVDAMRSQLSVSFRVLCEEIRCVPLWYWTFSLWNWEKGIFYFFTHAVYIILYSSTSRLTSRKYILSSQFAMSFTFGLKFMPPNSFSKIVSSLRATLIVPCSVVHNFIQVRKYYENENSSVQLRYFSGQRCVPGTSKQVKMQSCL